MPQLQELVVALTNLLSEGRIRDRHYVICSILATGGPTTRGELASICAKDRSSTNRALRELMELGLIREHLDGTLSLQTESLLEAKMPLTVTSFKDSISVKEKSQSEAKMPSPSPECGQAAPEWLQERAQKVAAMIGAPRAAQEVARIIQDLARYNGLPWNVLDRAAERVSQYRRRGTVRNPLGYFRVTLREKLLEWSGPELQYQ